MKSGESVILSNIDKPRSSANN